MNPDQEGDAVRTHSRHRHVAPDAVEDGIRVDFVTHCHDTPKIQNTLVQVVCEDIWLDLEFFAIFHPFFTEVHSGQVDHREDSRATPPDSLEWISIGFLFQIVSHDSE